MSQYRFDVDVWEVTDGRPFLPEEVFVSQHDDGTQLMAVKVGRPQRRDEVAQAEQWILDTVRETTHDHVIT